MGYDLHITRAEFWFESEEKSIALDEWKEYVATDPELKIDPVNNDNDNELMVLWYGDNAIPDDSEGIGWLWWREGQVETKNPDDSLIEKMSKIAAYFNARVVGDDDETYWPIDEKQEITVIKHDAPSIGLMGRFVNTVCKILVILLAQPLSDRLEKWRKRRFDEDDQ